MNDAIAVVMCFAGCYWLMRAWQEFQDRHYVRAKPMQRPFERRGLWGWIVTIVCLLFIGTTPYNSHNYSESLDTFTAVFGLLLIGGVFLAGGISIGLTT